MCDEHADFSDAAERTSRKWRRCDECLGVIAPGDLYVHYRSFYDGAWSTADLHMACDSIADYAAKVFGDEGCRILDSQSSISMISHHGSYVVEEPAYTIVRALLRWMKRNTRARFGAALAQAWGAV